MQKMPMSDLEGTKNKHYHSNKVAVQMLFIEVLIRSNISVFLFSLCIICDHITGSLVPFIKMCTELDHTVTTKPH